MHSSIICKNKNQKQPETMNEYMDKQNDEQTGRCKTYYFKMKEILTDAAISVNLEDVLLGKVSYST